MAAEPRGQHEFALVTVGGWLAALVLASGLSGCAGAIAGAAIGATTAVAVGTVKGVGEVGVATVKGAGKVVGAAIPDRKRKTQ